VIAERLGIIVDWSGAAEAIFRWAREQAIGMTLTETVIPEEQHSAHLAGICRFRGGGAGTMANRRLEVVDGGTARAFLPR